MTEMEVTIKNRAGLHARPAALLVQIANKFESKIIIEKDEVTVNAKSIMGIMTLGASHNTVLKIISEGSDEVEATMALQKLFDNKFEEA